MQRTAHSMNHLNKWSRISMKAQFKELDAHVGEILDRLDQLQLSDRTLVIFTSDNGAGLSDFRGGGTPELNLASDAGGILEKFRTAKRDARALGHLANGDWRGGKGITK